MAEAGAAAGQLAGRQRVRSRDRFHTAATQGKSHRQYAHKSMES